VRAWVFLGIAIISEVIGTALLKESDGFSKLWATLGSLACYGLSLYLLSIVVQEIDLGIAYAVWAGVGTALIVLIGWIIFGQQLDPAAIVGVLMIVGGVVVINAFSTAEG
jgi:small multidrug resistance pump